MRLNPPGRTDAWESNCIQVGPDFVREFPGASGTATECYANIIRTGDRLISLHDHQVWDGYRGAELDRGACRGPRRSRCQASAAGPPGRAKTQQLDGFAQQIHHSGDGLIGWPAPASHLATAFLPMPPGTLAQVLVPWGMDGRAACNTSTSAAITEGVGLRNHHDMVGGVTCT